MSTKTTSPIRRWTDEAIIECYTPQVKELKLDELMALVRGDLRDRLPDNAYPIIEDLASAELQRRGTVLPVLASLMEPLVG